MLTRWICKKSFYFQILLYPFKKCMTWYIIRYRIPVWFAFKALYSQPFLLSLFIKAIMGSKQPNLLSHLGSSLCVENLQIVQDTLSTSHMWHPLKRKFAKVMEHPPLTFKRIQKPSKSQLKRSSFPICWLNNRRLLYSYHAVVRENDTEVGGEARGFLSTVTSSTATPNAENASVNNSWLSWNARRKNCIPSVCWWRLL